jgi:hypothetical protein
LGFLGLEFSKGTAANDRKWLTSLGRILLTSLWHVNRPETGFNAAAHSKGVLDFFASSFFTARLAVAHKTVA